MKPTDIFKKVEGNFGKVCTVTLKSGEILKDRILQGTKGDDYGNFFIIITEGKSNKPVSAIDIDTIEVNC